MESKRLSQTLRISFAMWAVLAVTSHAWAGGLLSNPQFCEVENPGGGTLDVVSTVNIPASSGTAMITRQNVTYDFSVQLTQNTLSSDLSALETTCSLLYGQATAIQVNDTNRGEQHLGAAILHTLQEAGLNGFDHTRKVLVVTRQSVVGWLCPNSTSINPATGRCDGKTGGGGPSDSGTTFNSAQGTGTGIVTLFAENCDSKQLNPDLLNHPGVCGHP